MKDFNPIIDREAEKTEQVAIKQIEKQEKYHGSMKVHRGHRCYEYNFITRTVKEADYETIAAEFGKEGKVSKKVVMNPDCGYAVALNPQNAIKKIGKIHGIKLSYEKVRT